MKGMDNCKLTSVISEDSVPTAQENSLVITKFWLRKLPLCFIDIYKNK
jgi:hypothetical protein